MYSPVLGRFLQTDPLLLDAKDNNFYRYVGNNVINDKDALGLSFLGALCRAAAAADAVLCALACDGLCPPAFALCIAGCAALGSFLAEGCPK
jgi:hypothetical protein